MTVTVSADSIGEGKVKTDYDRKARVLTNIKQVLSVKKWWI